jgi:N-acetylmuramoyl-L-alanine amidase
MRHHLLIIFLCSVILSVFGRAETAASAPPSGAKPAAKAKAKATPAAGGKKTAPEKKPATAGAGVGTPEKSATGPSPTRAKPGWNVIDYRGQAYLDLAEVAKFFEFPTYTREGKSVTLEKSKRLDGREFPIRCHGQAGSKLVSINALKFYLSYPLVAWRDGRVIISSFDLIHVIDPILRPDQQREPSQLKVVVLDAARGGSETGQKSRFGVEKDVTLAVARLAKTELENAGYKVVMTRSDDSALDVPSRIKRAGEVEEESILVSLHCGFGGEKERGVEMFTLAPSGTPTTAGDEGSTPDSKFYPGNINDRESMALATALQGALVAGADTEDLGIRRARFQELKGVNMPAVVCNLGRLGHPVEGKKLGSDPDYHRQLARALAVGVERYARVMAAGSPPRARVLQFAKVESGPVVRQDDGGETVHVKAAIARSAVKGEIDPSKVTLQIYFLDFVNGEEIDLSSCDTPTVTWLSALPDWKEAAYEEVDFTYLQPGFDAELVKQLGRRTYCGFVLRLVYDGELMDEYAEPANLRRGLGTFTTVLPRRK